MTVIKYVITTRVQLSKKKFTVPGKPVTKIPGQVSEAREVLLRWDI